jgi:hypothetical protein
MEEERPLSDQFLEHCLTSTPTLEGVKAFLCSHDCSIYTRYLVEEHEERRRLERAYQRARQMGKLEAKTEIVEQLLLLKIYTVQHIAEYTKTRVTFVERIKSKLNL